MSSSSLSSSLSVFFSIISSTSAEGSAAGLENRKNPRAYAKFQGDFLINNAGVILLNERKWQSDKDFVVSKDVVFVWSVNGYAGTWAIKSSSLTYN